MSRGVVGVGGGGGGGGASIDGGASVPRAAERAGASASASRRRRARPTEPTEPTGGSYGAVHVHVLDDVGVRGLLLLLMPLALDAFQATRTQLTDMTNVEEIAGDLRSYGDVHGAVHVHVDGAVDVRGLLQGSEVAQ